MKKNILLILLILIFIVCYSLYINEYNYLENFIEAKVVVPKNIYVFLNNNQLSVQMSKTSNWKINAITKNTIQNYVNNDNLELYKKFNNKALKDLVSLEVIYTKGGIYIDQETLITFGNILINYVNDLYFKEYDCCLLAITDVTTNITSWIYIAPKNSKFIKKLHTILFNEYQNGNDYNKINNDIINNLLEDYMFSYIQRNENSGIFYGISLSKPYRNNLSSLYIENYYRKPPIIN